MNRKKISNYYNNSINEGVKNFHIGGHYNFPKKPSDFAINSIDIANKMQNTNKDELLSFINDLRVDNLCNYGVCDLPILSTESKRNKTIQNISDLLRFDYSEVEAVQSKYSAIIDEKFIRKIKRYYTSGYSSDKDITNYVTQEFKNKMSVVENTKNINLQIIYDLIKSSFNSQSTGNYDDFFLAIDRFIYAIDKNYFHPLPFSRKGIKSKVLFEKHIYNYSSKIIRKLSKKKQLSNLKVEKIENTLLYKCTDYNGNDILLRRETSTENVFKAVNKCPLIIATLYYKIISGSNTKKINLFYMIPSYDRSKVNQGTESFFNLFFPYLQKKNGLEEVTIHNIYWTCDQGNTLICDKFMPKYKETTICTNDLKA